MNVLSLFDGMSCGQLALQRAGVKVDNYYACEIDKHAIKVCLDNFPDTKQLGSVKGIMERKDKENCFYVSTVNDCMKNESGFPIRMEEQIDLVIGGSPCQGFSFAGKGLNFNDPRSELFFEYVRILRHCKPKYFLLENVGMLQKYQDVITEQLGVKPIFINSRLVSAQDRKRLYWTNIPNIEMPQDKNISWSDISEDGWFAGSMRGRRINEFGKRDDYNKDIKIVQHIESRKDNKTNCLTTVGKDNIASKQRVGRTPLTEVEWRYLTRNEMEQLQTMPDNYTKAVSLNQAGKMLGNGWTVDIIAHLFKNLLHF